MAMADLAAAIPADRSLLIVEDDKSFLQRLARAMESRGFTVTTAESVADGLAQLETISPAFAVVDMRLEDGNGLEVISALKRRRPDARAIILTGYGNIATAVNAVKLGAVDYLSKPVDADDVVAALLALDGRKAEPPQNPMSADRVRWEHIQRIYELCGRNVSRRKRDKQARIWPLSPGQLISDASRPDPPMRPGVAPPPARRRASWPCGWGDGVGAPAPRIRSTRRRHRQRSDRRRAERYRTAPQA